MKTKELPAVCLFLLLTLLLSACQTILPTSVNEEVDSKNAKPTPSTTLTNTATAIDPTPTQKTETPTAEATEAPTIADQDDETQELTPENDKPVGPDNFPNEVNPLTGLPAENSELLELPPALISISNFPASARPQAGLNSSPITFEMAIGEGMTRFLALFYGQFPEGVSGLTEGNPTGGESTTSTANNDDENGGTNDAETSIENAKIGPIRSGRLPYEDIRSLYTGFLVMASAWEGVATNLSETTSVFGDDAEDINSALVEVDQLKQIAQAQADEYTGKNFYLEGMKFSQTPPTGGQTAYRLWVFYSMLNQVQWRYDEELGAYVRYDIKTDNSGEFVVATDRLTEEPVSKENIIVIYAEHDYKAPTLIDINLVNRPPTKALLLRDREIHEIFWTTQFGEYEKETGLLRPMRFVDADANPVPLKPGQTWISIVSLSSYHKESAVSDQPFHPIIEEPGSGLWLVRYKGKY